MKSQKITSFSAHDGKTNCLKIGPKSGRVLVTGGQDRMVNLWAIGKVQPILHLSGHVTGIECVSMDWPEEIVVAGSVGGSLKLWDLAEQKVIRTLPGHRSAVSSVEFHPFGEFFASGSVDQTVKLWDVKRKGCIQTYHGHGERIGSLKISPDGRWIASGSDDGTVKIWDMTAGKLLHTLDDASKRITSVCFNPSEFVLSSASADGHLRVYDLQKFELISTTKVKNPDQIIFTPNGQHLLSTCEDSLEIYEWEPLKPISSSSMQWHPIKDLQFLPETNKVITCSTNGHFIDITGFRLDVVSPDGESFEDRSDSPFVQLTPEPIPTLPQKTKDSVQIITRATENMCITGVSLEDTPPMQKPVQPNMEGQQIERKSKSTFKYVTLADGNGVLNLDLTTFLKGGARGQNKMLLGTDTSVNSPLEMLESLSFRHSSVQGILNTKLHQIQSIRDSWNEESVVPSLQTLSSLSDSSVVLDILRVINCKPKLINLESATILLPLLNELLFSIYEEYFLFM